MLGRVKSIRIFGAFAFIDVTSSASLSSAMGTAPVKMNPAVMHHPDKPDQHLEVQDLKRFVKSVQRGDWVGKLSCNF